MFHRLKQKGVNAIYAMHSIEGFASSLIGIFIPIYLLKIGYPLKSVFVFFIVHNLSLAVFSVFAGYLTSATNYRRPLYLRFPVLFLYLVLLYNLPVFPAPLALVAALSGMQAALYWTPLNILFAKNTRKDKLGSSIGKLFALPQLAALFGPLLGGLIAANFGFRALFITAFCFLLASLLPLLTAGDLKSDFRFEFRRGVRFFLRHPKYIVTEFFDNIGGEMEGVIWPIFIYLSLLNVVAVGAIGTLITLGTILFTLLVGAYTDKADKRLLMRIGALSVLGVWTLRYLTDSETVYFLTTVLAGFALSLILVPYTSRIFAQAKKREVDEFFVVKELPTVIGRIAIFSLALAFVDNLKLLFPVAGAAYLSFFLL